MIPSGMAIDAGWLRIVDEPHGDVDYFFKCIGLLEKLTEQRVPILLDHKGHIVAEYERVLRPNSFGRKFFTHRMRHGLFEFHAGTPDRRCREALRADRFDASDLPYVGVAQAAGGIYLTHETKHFEHSRRQLVRKHCGLVICDTQALHDLIV